MFEGLRKLSEYLRIYRRTLSVDTALQETNRYFNRLLASEAAQKRYIGIRTLKNKDEDAVQEFRDFITDEIQKIFQSSKPAIALRKVFIRSLQTSCMYALLWTEEEFHNRRQVIYAFMNKHIKNPGEWWSDEMTAGRGAWYELESVCLLPLEISMVNSKDWWTDYDKLYKRYIKNFYRSLLATARGDKSSASFDFIIMEISQSGLYNMERRILGKPITSKPEFQSSLFRMAAQMSEEDRRKKNPS